MGQPGDRRSRRRDGALLVLGVGNVLLRDEGVGVHVARAVEALDPRLLPPGTEVVDGGTLGIDLLPVLGDADGVVLIDAVDLRSAPGTLHVLRGEELEGALAGRVAPHRVGVGDLLATARLAGALPGHVSLVAVQPGRIEVGLELTPAVGAAVPAAVELVRQELEAFAVDRGAGPRSRPPEP